MHSLGSKRKHCSAGAGCGLILGFAFGARQLRIPAICHLEYRLLTKVVHAGLAKIVRWLSICGEFFQAQDKRAGMNLFHLVSVPLGRLLLQFSNTLAKCAALVFRRAFRLGARKQFLLEVQTGILDLNQYPCDFLLSVGDLALISCTECVLRQADGGAEATEGGSNVHGVPCVSGVNEGIGSASGGAEPDARSEFVVSASALVELEERRFPASEVLTAFALSARVTEQALGRSAGLDWPLLGAASDSSGSRT